MLHNVVVVDGMDSLLDLHSLKDDWDNQVLASFIRRSLPLSRRVLTLGRSLLSFLVDSISELLVLENLLQVFITLHFTHPLRNMSGYRAAQGRLRGSSELLLSFSSVASFEEILLLQFLGWALNLGSLLDLTLLDLLTTVFLRLRRGAGLLLGVEVPLVVVGLLELNKTRRVVRYLLHSLLVFFVERYNYVA